ncbi:MAG: hypothetical protein GF401_01985 [Chitinivibrionales bacterium]|nr:hypothetical protein [Chitinivibrionales bacterium]
MTYTIIVGTNSATLLTSGTKKSGSSPYSLTNFGLNPGATYAWAVVVSDGDLKDTSEVRSFHTKTCSLHGKMY